MVGNHWLPEGFGLTSNFRSSLREAILEKFCPIFPLLITINLLHFLGPSRFPAVCDLLSWMAQELKAGSGEPGSGEVGKCDWQGDFMNILMHP
jgi:hypothetical protein